MSERDANDIDEFFSTARVAGHEGAIELPGGDYREFLYALDDPVLAPYRGMSYEEFTADRYQAPFLRELLDYWDSLLAEPFVGITTDGAPRQGLYAIPPPAKNDAMLVGVARRALSLLDEGQRDRVAYPIDSRERRAWSNPEFVFHRVGVRLEDLPAEHSDALLGIVRASLSAEGWAQVDEAMQLNGFLGELTELPRIMNHRSYWFSIYGAPSTDEPWGWQLFGHHVCLNFLTIAGRHVIAPVFIGGEPAVSDAHPSLFARRESLALELAASLTPAQRSEAVVYDSVLDSRMPEGRLHPADERHVAGAFRDNRVVPYEGVAASGLDDVQWSTLRAVLDDALLLYRQDQRELVLADIDAHRSETHFAWYGATDGSTPFYFRVHSPVILIELDHHAGVWLSNRLPARFHVHTTLRLPNGNDYGYAYLAGRAAASPDR